MALLAINKRIDTLGLSINDETSEQAGTIALLKRYLDEFGHRGCVRDDLLPYLHTGTGNIDGELESVLEAMVTETSSDYKSYMRNQNARKLLRCAMPSGDREAEIQAGKAFLEQYFVGAPYGKDLPITDVRPADDFGLMAAQAWISAWRLDKAAKDARTLLVVAAATLERVLKDSPANGQVRMLLIRVYRLIGKQIWLAWSWNILNIAAPHRYTVLDRRAHCSPQDADLPARHRVAFRHREIDAGLRGWGREDEDSIS